MTPLRVLPVVHAEDKDGVLRALAIVQDVGADGAFLINHYRDHWNLFDNLREAREEFASMWLGVNILNLSLPVAARHVAGSGLPTDGLWSDDGYHHSLEWLDGQLRPLHQAMPNIQIFGGIAHKASSTASATPKQAAQYAKEVDGFYDFVTTTGPRTGVPPELDQVKAMGDELAKSELAIASGLDSDNIASFAPYIGAAIVASSIEANYGELSATKLEVFVKAARVHSVEN